MCRATSSLSSMLTTLGGNSAFVVLVEEQYENDSNDPEQSSAVLEVVYLDA